MELVVFVMCSIGWVGTGYLLLQKRTLIRWGFFLLMSVWLYTSVMLLVFATQPPLWLMLFLGILPVLCIAYGYRLYDHYSQREKIKRKIDLVSDSLSESES